MAGGDKARRKSVCARRGAHVFAIKKFFCEVSHTGVELGVGLCDPIGFMERCRCPKGFYADDSIFLGQWVLREFTRVWSWGLFPLLSARHGPPLDPRQPYIAIYRRGHPPVYYHFELNHLSCLLGSVSCAMLLLYRLTCICLTSIRLDRDKRNILLIASDLGYVLIILTGNSTCYMCRILIFNNTYDHS